jgi:hypothetical protein
MTMPIPMTMLADLAAGGTTLDQLTADIGQAAVTDLAAAYAADERQAALEADPALLGIAARWTAQVLQWPVFPLMPRAKDPYPGSHGFKDATLDPAHIDWLWQRAPHSNIGVPTGHLFDVIDIDGPAGRRSYDEMCASGIALPPTLAIARTGRPDIGHHLFIAPVAGRRNTSGTRSGMPEGIDTRAAGGYVVIPPSVHPSGERYRWEQAPYQPAPTTSSLDVACRNDVETMVSATVWAA